LLLGCVAIVFEELSFDFLLGFSLLAKLHGNFCLLYVLKTPLVVQRRPLLLALAHGSELQELISDSLGRSFVINGLGESIVAFLKLEK
jgi:hypothetical protein